MMLSTVNQPPFNMTYWRPWNEESNLFESYFDYVRDTSLQEYNARIIGSYISQSTIKQVDAINNLADRLGFGLNIISWQLNKLNDSSNLIHKKLDLQLEQQKLTNAKLDGILKLLNIPESEKERRYTVEMGLKFYVMAQRDKDLLNDALEAFLKAEASFRQDYFVLYQIGMIYLFSEKHLDPAKAFEYFKKSAKYANAAIAISPPKIHHKKIDDFLKLIDWALYQTEMAEDDWEDASVNFSVLEDIESIAERIHKHSERFFDIWYCAGFETLYGFSPYQNSEGKYTIENSGSPHKRVTIEDSKSANNPEILASAKNLYEFIKDKVGAKAKITVETVVMATAMDARHIASAALEKAAFSAYVLGNSELALENQIESVKHEPTASNYFMLAKYQARNGLMADCCKSTGKCIDLEPKKITEILGDLDLCNEIIIINLINKKIDEAKSAIDKLIVECQQLEIDDRDKSSNSNEFTAEVRALLEFPYHIQVYRIRKFAERILNWRQNLIAKEVEFNDLRAKCINLANRLLITVADPESRMKLDEAARVLRETALPSNPIKITKLQSIFDKNRKLLSDHRKYLNDIEVARQQEIYAKQFENPIIRNLKGIFSKILKD